MVISIRTHRLLDATPVPTPSAKHNGCSAEQIPRSTESLVHDLNSTGGRSCCDICRDYIRNGHPPDTVIHFVRDRSPAFTKDHALDWWACREVAESDGEHWMRFKKKAR